MSDTRDEKISAEEAELLADEAALPETAEAEPEPAKEEFIEFLGDPKYGTEFTVGHSISRKHLRETHDISTPKDLEWTKGKNGRFLVPVADMSPEAADLIVNDPAFKLVTL